METTETGMLTLFTTCKPFVGLAAVHQRNALKSWTLLEPRPEVIVFGDEEGAAWEAERLGLLHVEYVKRDGHGLPRLDFMFERAQVAASNDLLMWANADIVMVDGATEAARDCDEAFPDGFLGVCRRWDVNWDEPLDFGGDWRGELREAVRDSGELYTPCSSDVFLFKRPLPWAMLPFVAGRGRWDNWMLFQSIQAKIPIVDMTELVLIMHPRHKGSGYDRKALDKDAAGQRNSQLASRKLFCFKHVKRAKMLWQLNKKGNITKTL